MGGGFSFVVVDGRNPISYQGFLLQWFIQSCRFQSARVLQTSRLTNVEHREKDKAPAGEDEEIGTLSHTRFTCAPEELFHQDTNLEDDQLANMTTDDIVRASRLVDNEIHILKEELQRTNLELESHKENIKENQEKIKLNKQLPYLVGNIVKILEMNLEDVAEEDGVLKTSTQQVVVGPSGKRI